LLKKGKAFSNLAALQQNKKAKLAKGHQDQKPKPYAYLTNLGGRSKNEDRVAIETIATRHQRTYQYFAVFDGHGGYLTSNYLSLHLHLVL
jgi:serine/threonine protein phosphatase PrpC